MTAGRSDGAVLRGLALRAQPVTLARARTALQEVAAPPAEPARVDVEQLLALAREEGIAQGRAEESQARDEQWASTLDAARARAQQEGRSQGLEDGRREAAQRSQQAQVLAEHTARERLGKLDTLVESAARAVEAWRSEAEEDLVGLAHDIACRVLGAHAIERTIIEHMTRHVLKEHGSRTSLAVHVHPDDFEHIAESQLTHPWEWVADAAITIGGVVLRSPQGSLDARLETQLRALGDALLAHREQRRRQQAEAAP